MPAGSLSFPLLSPVALAAVLTSSTPLALGKAQASLALLSLLRRCGVAVHKPETMKRAPWVYDVSRVTS